MWRKTHFLVAMIWAACFWANGAWAQNNIYYLPQIANGGYGGGFKTTFVLCNNSGAETTAILDLFDDAGSPLVMALDGKPSSQFVIQLPAGSTRMLETDGTGSLVAGIAKVSSAAEIGVAEIFRVYDADGVHFTETGIANAKPLSSFVLPVDTTGFFNTAVAFLNTAGVDAAVTLTLRDSSGRQFGSPLSLTIEANRHVARYISGVGQLFPPAADFQGSLLVQSSQPLASMALRENASPLSYTSLSSISTTSAGQKVYFPQVANGSFGSGGYRTSFLITNIAAAAANVNLSLTDDNGSPLAIGITGQGKRSNFTFPNLAPGASLFLQTDASGSLVAGSAAITSDVPIGVSGIFTVLDPTGAFQTEAAVDCSAAQTSFMIPVVVTGTFDTGIAFRGTSGSDASLRIQLLDAGGNAAGSSVRTNLPINGHLAKMVSELFPGIENFKGSIFVSSTAEVAALTLRTSTSPLSLTTLPVIDYVKGSFSGNILLGAPTSNSIKLSVLSADQGGSVSVQYGTNPGKFEYQTSSVSLSPGIPAQVALAGLNGNTEYYYRLIYDASGGSGGGPTD